MFDFFLPQAQKDKQNTDIANQSVISSECIWSPTVGDKHSLFLRFVGWDGRWRLYGWNKIRGKMINQGTWRQTVTFRWFITIIKLCHSSSEAVKYLLQLLIMDTMRTRCHVPTAAAIYLSHVGTHWPPSRCFADSPRGKRRQRSASSVHVCFSLSST